MSKKRVSFASSLADVEESESYKQEEPITMYLPKEQSLTPVVKKKKALPSNNKGNTQVGSNRI